MTARAARFTAADAAGKTRRGDAMRGDQRDAPTGRAGAAPDGADGTTGATPAPAPRPPHATARAGRGASRRPRAPDTGGRRAAPGARSGEAQRTARATQRRGRYKRPFDLAVTTLAVVVLSPLWVALALAIAAAIRLEDGGRVFYRQPRLGRDGRVFRILKFRTMAEDVEERSGPVWAARRDTRTTAVGRVLRRHHLDELPQVVNVLRGEMSLVGPRPERPELAARIEREVPGFARRLEVRPGIAGLAQARGGLSIGPRRKLRYDLLYIAAMNPWLDLKLCLGCAWMALRAATHRPPPDRRTTAGGVA